MTDEEMVDHVARNSDGRINLNPDKPYPRSDRDNQAEREILDELIKRREANNGLLCVDDPAGTPDLTKDMPYDDTLVGPQLKSEGLKSPAELQAEENSHFAAAADKFLSKMPEVMEKMGQGADGTGGFRMNAGKNRIDLLPEIWIWALADVMTQGARKYPERNWEKGMDWSSMIGCMHRHLAKFQSGQRYDGPRFDKKEGTTGCNELAMVAWNALALMLYDIAGIGNNDLPSRQLDLFSRVNAETSDLGERIND